MVGGGGEYDGLLHMEMRFIVEKIFKQRREEREGKRKRDG